ncbi:PREDICTED: LOW QUALITY PROTEIN: ARF GTPase-activating protein GIT1 [Aptenodytes forsteri]|uniref:LOW QUALITY PROTEIN: ARF GTPase-activating protein GIT1 n=1 Tax=Aptenodytes forsteri TaxID=9233 RepID=UPI0009050A8F|nr:PREDICTED: LOW QUALITY PROTEIN: ARF GTPase-activating protein GIT1 [Aptenodytes forsteri]
MPRAGLGRVGGAQGWDWGAQEPGWDQDQDQNHRSAQDLQGGDAQDQGWDQDQGSALDREWDREGTKGWDRDPGWASINRGVLICDECCSVHRSLGRGRHISIVQPLRHSPWPTTLLQMVHTLASNGANSIWEHSLLDPAQVQSGRRKANPQDKVHPTKSEFIRAKYQMLAFVHKLPCRDDDGVTAKDLSKQLHSSVRTGNLETCLRLLSLGAQANFFHPEKGTTPLHVAAKAGQILQAELLVVYGADPGAPDVNGRTPIDYTSLDLSELAKAAKKKLQAVTPPCPPPDALDYSLRSQSDLDDQHDYDSVASDEDTDQELLRNASRNNRARSMDSSDLSDGPITLQEYLEVKKALAASEAKVQQLMKVNNSLSDELRRLQREVGAGPAGPPPRDTPLLADASPPGTAPPPRRDRQAFSMYEPGSALKPFGQPVEELVTRLQPFGAGEVEDEALYSMHIPASVYRIRKGPSASSVPFPPSSPLLSCPPDGARHMSKLDRHGSGTDSDYDNTQAGEVLISMEGKRLVELSKDEDFPHELDPLDGELDPGLPSTEDVILKTEQVTKNIQELLRAAQESKHDR